MSVKSTVELTHEEAVDKYIHLIRELGSTAGIRDSAENMSSEHLSILLETLNDMTHNGEGYENYRIVADKDDE